MKKIIFILCIISLFSCKKSSLNDIVGLYEVTGEKVRCSYFYCDTTLVNSILEIQKSVNGNTYIYLSLYDSITNDYNNLGALEFIKTNSKESVFSGYYTTNLTLDKEINFLNYYQYINNHDHLLEDTSSYYIRLEGYKQ